MTRKKRSSKAGRTSAGKIKKGYRLTKSGRIVKSKKRKK